MLHLNALVFLYRNGFHIWCRVIMLSKIKLHVVSQLLQSASTFLVQLKHWSTLLCSNFFSVYFLPKTSTMYSSLDKGRPVEICQLTFSHGWTRYYNTYAGYPHESVRFKEDDILSQRTASGSCYTWTQAGFKHIFSLSLFPTTCSITELTAVNDCCVLVFDFVEYALFFFSLSPVVLPVMLVWPQWPIFLL